MKKGVLCFFVKTPGLSPIKTRLAQSIGSQQALEFYQRSLVATAALARKLKNNIPHLEITWAVAEPEGMTSSHWAEFNPIYQGTGTLGDRLHKVYSTLIEDYDYVGFMGADSPHLSYSELHQALGLTSEKKTDHFIIGDTKDGGFYFFGGGISLPPEVWLNVEYSTNKTSFQLAKNLSAFGAIQYIKKNFDIDTLKDLKDLKKITVELLPEQTELINWCQQF